jgi:GT2 family glycosyltransferase
LPLRCAVAAIVLNYDSTDLTIACVEALLGRTDPGLDIHVRVVDNGSRDEERAALVRWAEDQGERVSLRLNPVNRGFGGGMSDGLEGLEARYYFFLNNDALVEGDVVSILVRTLDAHPRVGLAGPAQRDASGAPRSAYGTLPSISEMLFGRALSRRLRRAPPPPGREAGPVERVSGAAMFVRARAFSDVGGFDPRLFLYGEEEDLAWRLSQRGWEVWHVPGATIRHLGGGSSRDRPALERLYYRSYLYVIRKHRGRSYERLYRLLLVLKLARRALRGRVAWALVREVARGGSPS